MGGLDSKEFDTVGNMFHIQIKNELFGENWIECFATATVIMGATYE